MTSLSGGLTCGGAGCSTDLALQVGLVASHLQEVVDRCLELAVQGSLLARTTALQVGRWR